MTNQPFAGFRHFTTHHCITGSLRHIYAYHGYPISEEMLLGLGAGVGFIYWHMKGGLPFLGGRANVGRPGEEGLEKTAGRRTGVEVECIRTDSATRAEKALLELLSAGKPAMLMVDMGYLPYFDFGGEEFHFGGHAVVACGYNPDSRQALVADRDEALHLVSLQALAQARGSKHQPFPPRHAWFDFDFSHSRPPEAREILRAIGECAQGMMQPPIANLGVRGISKAAERIRGWPAVLGERDLRLACINTAILIDARGGSGGGLFRYLYGRFLAEAGEMTGLAELAAAGQGVQAAGDGWEQAAGLFEQAWTAEGPGALLESVSALLAGIAVQEEKAWNQLRRIVEMAELDLAG